MLSKNRKGGREREVKGKAREFFFFLFVNGEFEMISLRFSRRIEYLRRHREMGIFSNFGHNQATFSIHFADFESSYGGPMM